MKKSFITSLIVLICVALIGLIAIQIYWIQNTVALRDAQFRRSVKTAIADFNHVLEREEAMERMRKYDLSKKMYAELDSIKKSRPMGSLLVTHGGNDGDTALYISETGEYAFKFSNQRKTAYFFDPFDATSAEVEGNESAAMNLSQAQSELFVELLTGFLQLNMGTDFISRHSVQSLDSMIKQSLRDISGISAGYYFGIFDVYDKPLLISEDAVAHMELLINEGQRTRLFPSDLVQEPIYLRVWFPRQETYLLRTMWPLLLSSAIFMLTVIFAFGYSIRTILYQKKLSAIKNDFINNMTHELKTPISTISLACEALSDPAMSKSEARVSHFLKMIKDENKRLGVLVENVLRSAVLDRGEMKLNRDGIDMHDVILAVIRNIELQAQQRGGSIDTDLRAENAVIKGDRVHLTNVIYNLLDNAIKYSGENLHIQMSTSSNATCIDIRVKDNGIGIRKEDQNRIFEKLFRVPTGDVHNIKGFGLGLSYVKMIVEKHHGTVSVQSELGKGSTFIIQLPFDYDI
jgi:two-component system phosphate regulon sensor histidine kinase PhoR